MNVSTDEPAWQLAAERAFKQAEASGDRGERYEGGSLVNSSGNAGTDLAAEILGGIEIED